MHRTRHRRNSTRLAWWSTWRTHLSRSLCLPSSPPASKPCNLKASWPSNRRISPSTRHPLQPSSPRSPPDSKTAATRCTKSSRQPLHPSIVIMLIIKTDSLANKWSVNSSNPSPLIIAWQDHIKTLPTNSKWSSRQRPFYHPPRRIPHKSSWFNNLRAHFMTSIMERRNGYLLMQILARSHHSHSWSRLYSPHHNNAELQALEPQCPLNLFNRKPGTTTKKSRRRNNRPKRELFKKIMQRSIQRNTSV